MLVLYKRWKKDNEFQLTKKNGLEQSKIKNHKPSPSKESHSVTDPLGKRVEETGDELINNNKFSLV